jgi:hypothetical protein
MNGADRAMSTTVADWIAEIPRIFASLGIGVFCHDICGSARRVFASGIIGAAACHAGWTCLSQ